LSHHQLSPGCDHDHGRSAVFYHQLVYGLCGLHGSLALNMPDPDRFGCCVRGETEAYGRPKQQRLQ
jgi:hypothetical protein